MSGSRAGRVDDREVPPDTPGRFGLRERAERRAGGNVPASLTLTTPAPGSSVADETAIASGRRVILAESEGLSTLAMAIDGSFAAVVALLAEVAGRVVVTGMGKSGHVACKIAATLASTGTPALYVHPAEASHGDLGMITPQDAVLALSNSGETSELRDLILYTRRFSIPLIGAGRAGAQHPGRGRRPDAAAARRRRSLPDGAGADHVHHLHAGSGRRAGRGVAGAARLLRA